MAHPLSSWVSHHRQTHPAAPYGSTAAGDVPADIVHILASVLRHVQDGELPLFAWTLGLPQPSLLSLIERCFPEIGPLERMDDSDYADIGKIVPERYRQLVAALSAHRADSLNPEYADWLARAIAAAALGHRELWRDLGLSGHESVPALFQRHFPSFSAGLTRVPDWKSLLLAAAAPHPQEHAGGEFANAVFFDEAQIDSWIGEDAPLLDLTTQLLGIGTRPARMQLRSRQATVAACTEEAVRLVERCGGRVERFVPSGSRVAAGQVLLSATGRADALLRAWKVAQNLLEYACGVATATAAMVDAVRAVNPDVAVLTTRKYPPGLRKLALKATLAGGAFPHRLGLGETLLVFPQHRALLDDWDVLRERLARVCGALSEKKVVIEAHDLDDAWQALAAGASVIQFDKLAPDALRAACNALRAHDGELALIAAGGIHAGNAADYAGCGVDALVTSSLHYAPPADIGVGIEPWPAADGV